jgi:hypothetical protein
MKGERENTDPDDERRATTPYLDFGQCISCIVKWHVQPTCSRSRFAVLSDHTDSKFDTKGRTVNLAISFGRIIFIARNQEMSH